MFKLVLIMTRIFYLCSISLAFILNTVYGQALPAGEPQKLGIDQARLEHADEIIKTAVENKEIPGAVFLITRHHKIVWRKAFGYKEILPRQRKMKADDIFDLASLTKPMVAAASIMILVDRGKLRLLDKVSRYFPDFIPWLDDSSKHKTDIRLIHLLTHTSGLPPYAPVKKLEEKYGAPAPDSLLKYIAAVKRHHKPGTYFKYSCLNFITLQRVVEKVSGQPLADFSWENIFKPLNLKDTFFKPAEELLDRCVPTEILKNEDKPLIGKVHDPLARIMMDCNSGNAGLFSTADDMAVYASMLLNGGEFNDTRILSKAAVRALISLPQGYEEFGRSLGWDLNSDYSSNQGDLFSKDTFGHTGYTGTSMIIDPQTETVVILLTNRAHPHDKGSVVRLRSLVANVIAGAVLD